MPQIHDPAPGDAEALLDQLLDLAADILVRQAQEQPADAVEWPQAA